MEHTKGIWRAEENGAGVTYIRSSQKHGLGNDIYIATMHDSLDGQNNVELLKQSRANAHLIVAAPKLLEALKYLRDTIDWEKAARKSDIECMKINELIDKAEGTTK